MKHLPTHLAFDLNNVVMLITELPPSLVLTDQPGLSWEYKQDKLFLNKINEGEPPESLVLDVVRGNVTIARENSTSLSQKWNISNTGLCLYYLCRHHCLEMKILTTLRTYQNVTHPS